MRLAFWKRDRKSRLHWAERHVLSILSVAPERKFWLAALTADLDGFESSSVYVALARLQRNGYIRAERVPSNRPVRVFTVTESGLRLLEEEEANA